MPGASAARPGPAASTATQAATAVPRPNRITHVPLADAVSDRSRPGGGQGQRGVTLGVRRGMEMFRALIGPDNGDATAAQLCARAIILFLLGIAYIRIAGRRTFSNASPLDIVVALVVGSNLSRAMTGKAPFWPALAATLLLVVLHRVFAMLTLRWGWLAKVMKAQPVTLVRDGVEDRKAMLWHGIG